MECSLNVETHHIYSSIHTHQRLRLHAIEKRSGNRIVVSDIEPLSNVNHTLTINTNTHTTHMIHLPKRFHTTHTIHSRQLLLAHRHSIPTNTHTITPQNSDLSQYSLTRPQIGTRTTATPESRQGCSTDLHIQSHASTTCSMETRRCPS